MYIYTSDSVSLFCVILPNLAWASYVKMVEGIDPYSLRQTCSLKIYMTEGDIHRERVH